MSSATASSRARPARVVLGIALAVGAIFLVRAFPVSEWLLGLVAWVRDAGFAGAAVFAAAYVAATVLLLPGAVLTLGAGFAYGPVLGALLVSPVSVLASSSAFLVARYVARGAVERLLTDAPRFSAIDAAVAASGFRIVLLLRLSPVMPFNLLNYGLGLTRVRLRDYVLASFVGMLPGTALYVYLGSLVTSATELLSGSGADTGMWSHALYAGGLAATVAVTVVVTRIARRALDETLAKEVPSPATPGEPR